MSTRRQFIQSLPAVGTAFAVAGHLVLEDSPARAQAANVPLKEHFHPKGKRPRPCCRNYRIVAFP